jgi:multiple sugar transport system substrate-binding protein
MQRTKYQGLVTLLVLLAVLLTGVVVHAQDRTELRITWWGSQNRHDRTIEVIEMYEAANPHIEIVYEFSAFGDYWTRLNTQAAGGNLACVMQHDYAFLAEWANRGLLVALDPYFEDGTIDRTHIPDSVLESGAIDGQVYGLSLGTNSPALIIDLDAFERAGVELPAFDWTWQDFEDISLALHDELGIYAISYGLWDPQFWRSLYLSLGANAFAEDGTQLGYEDDQPLIDYFEMILRLQEAGAVATLEDTVELSEAGVEGSPIVTGNEAMRYQWSNQVVAVYSAAGEDRNLKLWPLPRAEGAASGNYLKASMYFSITSQCPEELREESAKFIDFFVNDLEANEVLFAERGVPVSTAVADHLRPLLDPVGLETFEFIAAISDDVSPNPPPDPQGWSDISANVYSALFIEPVLYGLISVEEGVALLRSEANAILAQNISN